MKMFLNTHRKTQKSILGFNRQLPLLMVILTVLSIMAFMPSEDEASEAILMPGVVFEIEVTDHEQSPPKTADMEVMIEGRNIKMDVLPRHGQKEGGEMIFRGNKGKKGEFVVVDDAKKGFYVIDDAFINSMLGQIDKSKSMVDDALKHLTKEQREMIEKAQKQRGSGMPDFMKQKSKPEIKKTTERATKSGYPCVKYEVWQDGRKIREIWTTDWNNIDGGDEARDAFKEMNDFFDGFKEKIGSLPGAADPYDGLNFDNGFPVVTSNFSEHGSLGDESLEDEYWLKRSRRQRIDPDAFEPPSGYKRMSMGPQ